MKSSLGKIKSLRKVIALREMRIAAIIHSLESMKSKLDYAIAAVRLSEGAGSQGYSGSSFGRSGVRFYEARRLAVIQRIELLERERLRIAKVCKALEMAEVKVAAEAIRAEINGSMRASVDARVALGIAKS